MSSQPFFKQIYDYCESYVVENLIAKKSKPFTKGEFIKQFMESVAEIIYPNFFLMDFSKISLSHWTIARQIAKNIKFYLSLLKEIWKVKLVISNFMLWK